MISSIETPFFSVLIPVPNPPFLPLTPSKYIKKFEILLKSEMLKCRCIGIWGNLLGTESHFPQDAFPCLLPTVYPNRH